MKKQDLPPIVEGALSNLQQKYADSPATTNAGRVLRAFARFVPLSLLLKILVHKK